MKHTDPARQSATYFEQLPVSVVMQIATAAPPRCPWCAIGSGTLFSVSLTGTRRTLTYRCADCQQPWALIDRLPDLSDPRVFGYAGRDVRERNSHGGQ